MRIHLNDRARTALVPPRGVLCLDCVVAGNSFVPSLAPSVVDDYQVPFPFTGAINTVTVKLGPLQLTLQEMEAIGLRSQLKQ